MLNLSRAVSSALQRRIAVTRASIAPLWSAKLAQVPKIEVDQICPWNATYFQVLDPNNPTQDPNANTGNCYTCPPGQAPQMDVNGWVYCALNSCPQSNTTTYTQCGQYCASSVLPTLGLSNGDW